MSSSTPRVTIGGTFSIPSFFSPWDREIGKLVAVIVDVFDAEMPQAVDLAADAHPGVENVDRCRSPYRSNTQLPACPGWTMVILKVRGG